MATKSKEMLGEAVRPAVVAGCEGMLGEAVKPAVVAGCGWQG
jgi:hypothetical protein